MHNLWYASNETTCHLTHSIVSAAVWTRQEQDMTCMKRKNNTDKKVITCFKCFPLSVVISGQMVGKETTY